MTNRYFGFALIALLFLSGVAVEADSARELTWEDLLPEVDLTAQPPADNPLLQGSDPTQSWDHGSGSFEDAFSTPVYPTGVVEELDGTLVKIPGFIVPLELADGSKIKEFLLVPYFGACIHYPPPPPNQLVYVTAEEPFEIASSWDPIWAIGELKTEGRDSGFGNAGYTMVAQQIDEYEY